MKTTRIFAVLFLLLFSCQTTMKNALVTQRALELTAFSSEKSKLSLKSCFLSGNNKDFALNPTNKNYWWSWGNQYIDTAKVQALLNCGSGCELFAVNDKIVWLYPANSTTSNTEKSDKASQSTNQKPESVTFQYQNYQQQPITTQSTTQSQTQAQKIAEQPPSKPKPAEPKKNSRLLN